MPKNNDFFMLYYGKYVHLFCIFSACPNYSETICFVSFSSPAEMALMVNLPYKLTVYSTQLTVGVKTPLIPLLEGGDDSAGQ